MPCEERLEYALPLKPITNGDELAGPSLGLRIDKGNQVVDVQPGSVADSAGIRSQDVIDTWNGKALSKEYTAVQAMADLKASKLETLVLEVLRTPPPKEDGPCASPPNLRPPQKEPPLAPSSVAPLLAALTGQQGPR